MKFKRILSILCVVTCMLFVGCSTENNNASEKFFGDRSSNMKTLPLSEVEYTSSITEKISTIAQDGYALQGNAIAIKNGRIDRTDELAKIDIMLTNIQSTREFVSDLKQPDSKTSTKKALITALDDYSKELTDYKNLLSQTSITTTQLQNKIDVVIGKLDIVKQYAK